MSVDNNGTPLADDLGFTRRRMLAGASALAASGIFAVRPITTIAKASQTPTSVGTGANPQSGGVVLYGTTAEPPTMDPRASGSDSATRMMQNLFDTLVALDPDNGELTPGLATSWQAAEDSTSYTFKLRDNVTFHDGTPFNAQAVKYTFDSIVDPTLKSLMAISYLGPYDSTEVVDEYTVTVHFTEPYPAFINEVSSTSLAPVSPTAAEKMGPIEFGRAPVGTGPFKFKEWKQQVSMTLERNPNYNWPLEVYQHEGPAYIDELTINFIPEASTLSGSLESGQITITDGVPAQDIQQFQDNSDFQVLLPPIPGVPQILPLNAIKFPTDDLAVRQAINYAVDTETIVETLFFGTQPAAHGPLAASTSGYNPEVEKYYLYDPDKASQLLKEAGWVSGSGGVLQKGGRPLELVYITSTGAGGVSASAGELVQAYLTQVGFKVNLQVLEYAATAELMLRGEHNIARFGQVGTDPSVLSLPFHSRNISGTNFNRTMKPDPTLDQMLDAASAETDPDARRKMYQDIQIYIMDQALIIPLWEQTIYWGAETKLNALHPLTLGQMPFYDAWISE